MVSVPLKWQVSVPVKSVLSHSTLRACRVGGAQSGSLIFLDLALFAAGTHARRLFLGYRGRLRRPSLQTTITTGGTLTR